MQGFNRYHPPDFDWRKTATFNEYQGKHALGDRARKIDQGILIVRFELPFNIWCNSCNSHIGAGVRYNAQKSKVGNYLSTPIYGFKCKCAHCQSWFELRTDPKNAAYIVHEGAKRQESDWDPAEYGGHGVHDPDNPSKAAADAFSQLEKTVEQKAAAKTAEQRLMDLYAYSARTTEDPEQLNKRLRSGFRQDKKVRLDQEGRDDDLRARYGLSGRLALAADGAGEAEGSGEAWKAEQAERNRRLLLAGRSLASRTKGKGKEREQGSVDRLRQSVLANSSKRFHPFASSSSSSSSTSSPRPRPSTGRTILPPPKARKTKVVPPEAPPPPPPPSVGLVNYESD